MTDLIDPNAVPRHGGDVIYRVVDGEAILLNLESGYYYSLDPLGSEIWALCDGAHALDDILNHICAGYAVSPAQARGDLLGLLDDLVREGLLTIGGPEGLDKAAGP